MPHAVGPRRQPLREIYVNGSNPYAPPRRPALPDPLKKAIVAKHVEHPELSYRTIGEQLAYLGRPIHKQTVQRVCDRASVRASADALPSKAVTLPVLLATTKRKPKQKHPKKLLKNSELAQQIYKKIHQDQTHENAPYRSIYKHMPEAKTHFSFRSFKRFCRDVLDQKQRKHGHKPALTESNQQARIKHAEWGLERVETDIFIYTDETMWSFGEHGWHAGKATLDISTDANVHTCKEPSWQKDSWMFSVAICEGYVPRYHIWNKPSAAEIACNDAEHNGYIQAVKDCQKQD